MASFAIDTSKLENIRSNISYSCIPKISSAYNTVISVRTNLPSSVLNKKWIYSNLRSLYRDIENINEDCVKISNLLYKTIDKMNDAERRALRWNSLKNSAVDTGRAFIDDVKTFGKDLYNDYEEAKSWFGDALDKAYDTGAAVVEKVENWAENLTWEDVEDFFKTAGATIVVAFQSLTKGLITLLQSVVDLVIIVGTIVVTPFTAIADGVNYLLTGESGGFTKYYWDGAMNMVSDVGSLAGTCCNWLTENNPDWINEYSLIEAGGTVDQIIQGIGYMVGIIGISVATFGTATPVALACTAGSLGFAKGTAEAWEEGKDAFGGLVLGAINGGWEALQYYVGGKIGTSVFGKITSKIASPILQKLAVSGLRVIADSLTGAVEVPFQSIVAMVDTRVDDIDGNELSWDEAWEATGGWTGVIQQTAIAGLGSIGGEVLDFGKAFRNAKSSGKSLGDSLSDIYVDDLNTYQLNKENPFGRKNKTPVDISDNVENQVKNSFPNDSIDDSAIAMANYRTGKGLTKEFRFNDANSLPDLNSNFWKNIEHPEQILVYVDGKNMTFNEALVYKQNYEVNIKRINMDGIDNLTIKNLDYADIGMAEAATARLTSNVKRYIYNDTNDFIGLNSRIADNGLYHFTDAPDAILNSGYIKATGEKLKGPLGYLGPSYGNAKTFFFEGIPDVGAFATNLDEIPLKTTAVKIKPTSDILDSSKLKIRNLDDGAITWDGRFNLLDQNPTKEYFVLTIDNGKLKYINVPESIYNSYDNSAAGKQLIEFLSNKKNVQTIKNDYLVNTSFNGTNAKISKDVVHNSNFNNLMKKGKDLIDNLKFKQKFNKVEYEYVKDWRNIGTTSLDVEKNLKEMFFDDDYVIGFHRTPDGLFNDSIYNDGLFLTGHGSSGIFNQNIDLDRNISFVSNSTDFDYEKFLYELRSSGYYKSASGTGHAMIVKIPKADIDNFDKILKYDGMNYVLKPDYIVGDVFVDHSNIVSGNFKTVMTDDNLSNILLFERGKRILQSNEGSIDFSKFRKKKVDVEVDINSKDLSNIAQNANLEFEESLKRFSAAKRFSNDVEIAMKYKDPKQYLFFKLDNIAKTTGDPQLMQNYEFFKKLPNLDKNYDDLYSVVAPYLDANDMDVLAKMSVDSYISKFNMSNQKELYLYSHSTGPALAAYERGTQCEFTTSRGIKQVYDGSNKEAIQNLINYSGRSPNGLDVIDIDEYVKRIDKIIKNAPSLDEDIIVYRGVNGLFFDGKQLDIADIKPGQIINDKATVSTSLLKDKAYGQNDIMLEILVPKGTKGAYIESFVGGYSQQEFLLGRNTKFKAISLPEVDPITGKTIIKVEVVPPDSLWQSMKNTGANVISNFKSKVKNLFSKGNITTKLTNDIGAEFNHGVYTEELTGNYPNKFAHENMTNNI